jgi:hypothetical protein
MNLYAEPTLLIERGEIHTVDIWGKLYAWHKEGTRLWVKPYTPPEQRSFTITEFLDGKAVTSEHAYVMTAPGEGPTDARQQIESL